MAWFAYMTLCIKLPNVKEKQQNNIEDYYFLKVIYAS